MQVTYFVGTKKAAAAQKRIAFFFKILLSPFWIPLRAVGVVSYFLLMWSEEIYQWGGYVKEQFSNYVANKLFR